MSKEKKLFLSLSLCLGAMFILATVSIIFVFVIDFENTSQNIMSTVYLFLHSIIVAVAFYFSFKAYLQKSQLMNVFMIDEKGNTIKKSQIVAIVLCSIFFVIGLYSTLLVLNLSIPLSFFARGLKFCLMNVGYSVGIVILHFALYPKVFNK